MAHIKKFLAQNDDAWMTAFLREKVEILILGFIEVLIEVIKISPKSRRDKTEVQAKIVKKPDPQTGKVEIVINDDVMSGKRKGLAVKGAASLQKVIVIQEIFLENTNYTNSIIICQL
jgi:hypothetical protein